MIINVISFGTNAYVLAVKMVTKLLVNYLTIRNMKALILTCLMRKFIKFMKKHPHFEAYTSSNVKFNASSDALPKK